MVHVAPEVITPTPRSGAPIVGPELARLFRAFKRLQNGSDIRGIALEGVDARNTCAWSHARHAICILPLPHTCHIRPP